MDYMESYRTLEDYVRENGTGYYSFIFDDGMSVIFNITFDGRDIILHRRNDKPYIMAEYVLDYGKIREDLMEVHKV